MPITGYVSSCLGIALPSTVDPATTAWVNAVITNGGTVSSGRQVVVNNLIVSGKTKGWWTKMDLLLLLAAENQPSALTDLIVNRLAFLVGSPPFVTDRGYTGDTSSTNYINANYNPVANAVNFTQNSAHASAWSNDNNTTAVTGDALFGLKDDTALAGSNIGFTTPGTLRARINDNPQSGSQGSVGTRMGHWLVNRDSASTTQAYQNASLFSNPNAASGALLNGGWVILAYFDPSTPAVVNGCVHQVSMASIGGNLSSTDVANFYTDLRTYMTTVGVP